MKVFVEEKEEEEEEAGEVFSIGNWNKSENGNYLLKRVIKQANKYILRREEDSYQFGKGQERVIQKLSKVNSKIPNLKQDYTILKEIILNKKLQF